MSDVIAAPVSRAMRSDVIREPPHGPSRSRAQRSDLAGHERHWLRRL